MTTRHESTVAYVARLEAEIAAKKAEAAEYAAMAQPLLAEHEARQAAIAAEAAAAEQRNREHAARIAEIEAGVAEAKRQVEGERIAKIRDAVNASDAVKTLLERAYAEGEEYGDIEAGLKGPDWAERNKSGAVEGQRAMKTYLGLDVPADLWVREAGMVARLYGFLGLNWAAGFVVGEGPYLLVEIPGHGSWQSVYGPGYLAALCEQFPSLKAVLDTAVAA